MITDDDQNPTRPLPIGGDPHESCKRGCNDGLILARRVIEDGGGVSVFRCDCRVGLADGRPYQLWSSASPLDWIRVDELQGSAR